MVLSFSSLFYAPDPWKYQAAAICSMSANVHAGRLLLPASALIGFRSQVIEGTITRKELAACASADSYLLDSMIEEANHRCYFDSDAALGPMPAVAR
jgi:hypothetical protein